MHETNKQETATFTSKFQKQRYLSPFHEKNCPTELFLNADFFQIHFKILKALHQKQQNCYNSKNIEILE